MNSYHLSRFIFRNSIIIGLTLSILILMIILSIFSFMGYYVILIYIVMFSLLSIFLYKFEKRNYYIKEIRKDSIDIVDGWKSKKVLYRDINSFTLIKFMCFSNIILINGDRINASNAEVSRIMKKTEVKKIEKYQNKLKILTKKEIFLK